MSMHGDWRSQAGKPGPGHESSHGPAAPPKCRAHSPGHRRRHRRRGGVRRGGDGAGPSAHDFAVIPAKRPRRDPHISAPILRPAAATECAAPSERQRHRAGATSRPGCLTGALAGVPARARSSPAHAPAGADRPNRGSRRGRRVAEFARLLMSRAAPAPKRCAQISESPPIRHLS